MKKKIISFLRLKIIIYNLLFYYHLFIN